MTKIEKSSTLVVSTGHTPNISDSDSSASKPKPMLRIIDAIVVIIGIVVGAGIFRAPSTVAAATGSTELFLLAWVLGGLVSLAGALCYAELSTTFPNAGGDYHFLRRAFGSRLSFLFAWARMSVIQTGSIALLAYIVGDYIAQIYPFGSYGPALYAGIVILTLTIINIVGLKLGTTVQKMLVGLQFFGILLILLAGYFMTPSQVVLEELTLNQSNPSTAIGLALVFVLLTFGGWNEAGYISAELKSGSKKMVQVLIYSIVLITALYLLINLAFLRVLGIEGMMASDAVGIDLMRATVGEAGVFGIGLLVILSALTSINATIFTGARTNYALGKDFKVFSFLGKWNEKTASPINALWTQSGIALLLVVFGAFARSGFESMVEFTAPVFWFFFLATGISLFVLRVKEKDAVRPFKVPLYPLTPIVFCVSCAYLLYSSIQYSGKHAFIGIGVLSVGLLFFFVTERSGKNASTRRNEQTKAAHRLLEKGE